MDTTSRFIVGIYDDDEALMHGVEEMQHKGFKVADVFTPFPVHGLEKLLGYKESRLPIAAFIFGATGTSLALLMQIWMYAVDWQVNVGGKPRLPLPSFIPITFELTVLLGSLGMVATYMFVNRLAPGITANIVDPRQTDDKFVVTIAVKEDGSNVEAISQAFKASGASEVREQELPTEYLNIA